MKAKETTANAYESEKSINTLRALSRKSGIGIKVGTVESGGVYTLSNFGGTARLIRYFLSGLTPDKNGRYSAEKVYAKVLEYKREYGSEFITPELRKFLNGDESVSKTYKNISSVFSLKVLGSVPRGVIREIALPENKKVA
jgi:hypothetical protein